MFYILVSTTTDTSCLLMTFWKLLIIALRISGDLIYLKVQSYIYPKFFLALEMTKRHHNILKDA